jgi:hypothetical protein
MVPAAAVGAVVLATAATWAYTRVGNSRDTTSVECQADESGKAFSIVPSMTGNPVTDCQSEWKQQHGTPVPPMVAYDNGHGAVTVRLADAPVPEGATRLQPGKYQNVGSVELQAWMDDIGHGLQSKCLGESEARAAIQAELSRLDLTGWEIVVDPKRVPDGKTKCAVAGIGPEAATVHLLGMDGSEDMIGARFTAFAARIEDNLADRCQDLDSATAMVRSMAAGTKGEAGDVSAPEGVMIQQTPDASKRCTQATVEVGGTVTVTLVGPSN